MGGPSKKRCLLQLVDVSGIVKNSLDGKRYYVFVRQNYFNLNLDKTLLEEDQIEFFGVKVYSSPRVSGKKQLIDDRYQVDHSVKLGIF